MGYKVDEQQVVAMSKLLSNKVIAERLDISVRHVSRILSQRGASKRKRRTASDRASEDRQILAARDIGISYGTIGWMHGLSRQAVHKRINDNR
jgi:DNA-directed RNA polymerase specialized sigma24 family protein